MLPLIRLYRTPKTNIKYNLVSKSAYYGRYYMVFVFNFLCVFEKFVKKFTKVGKDSVQNGFQ